MNQRKPTLCPTPSRNSRKTPCALRRFSPSIGFGWSDWSSSPVFRQSCDLHAASIAAADIGNVRIGGRDITRGHVIMCAVNTNSLPSPSSSLTLLGMLTVPPFASPRPLGRFGRRSLGSLAAVAGRVANGLRVSPAGSCSPARCLAPSCPPLRALARGLFTALPFAPLAAQKSTVVSLL